VTKPTLADLCTLIADSEHKTAPKDPEGPHPLVRTTDLGNARVDFARAQRVNADTYAKWTRRGEPRTGDLILAREAPVGGVARVPEGVHPVLGQRTVLLRPGKAVDSRFLMYRLAAADLQARMNEMATGSTVSHLNMSDIRAIEIPDLPTVAEQECRAAVLAAFDELIEINERRIELLEDLARSLYREWFVRFRFPEAPRETSPDELPAGWVNATVGDLCDVVRGRSYKRAELSDEGGVPFLNLKCVARGGGFRRDGLKRYTGPFKPAQEVVAGEVLVAMTDMTQERRIVAQAFRVPPLGPPLAVPSLDLAVVRPREPRLRNYVYAVLRYSGFSERVRQFANGANVLHLAAERILEAPIVVPDARTLNAFSKHVEAFMRRAEACETANRVLIQTRDLLLPRLVTGQLDISDVDLGDLLPEEDAA
jgi:type I restriction enzyme S subunit